MFVSTITYIQPDATPENVDSLVMPRLCLAGLNPGVSREVLDQDAVQAMTRSDLVRKTFVRERKWGHKAEVRAIARTVAGGLRGKNDLRGGVGPAPDLLQGRTLK